MSESESVHDISTTVINIIGNMQGAPEMRPQRENAVVLGLKANWTV